jgi:hypothetical protein
MFPQRKGRNGVNGRGSRMMPQYATFTRDFFLKRRTNFIRSGFYIIFSGNRTV